MLEGNKNPLLAVRRGLASKYLEDLLTSEDLAAKIYYVAQRRTYEVSFF
jgi:hypothetical protein